MKTALSQSLEIADDKGKYDENIKNILANKIILAWILKYTVREFMDEEIENIVNLIENEPEVACVPIYPGRTNQVTKITGNSTDDIVPNEGEVKYDIRFVVYTLGNNRSKLLVNVEAQKIFYPGYNLVTRGVFYGARMLSAQLDREFTTDNYDDIKKVYSIWICMDSPQYLQNTITSYHMTQEDIYGNYSGKAGYDLLEVVMVCIGGNTDSGSRLIDMLNVLLSDELLPPEKEKVLADEFGIEPINEFRKEIGHMCNLSDIVEERGIAIGIVSIVETFVEKHNVSLEKVLDMLSVSLDEYNEAKARLPKRRLREKFLN